MMWQRWIEDLQQTGSDEFVNAVCVIWSRTTRGRALVAFAKDRVALDKALLDIAQRGQELQRKFDMITACLDGFKAGVKAVGK